MIPIKLAVVYQVVFHYRVPFYEKIESDQDFDSVIIHGSGIKNTKIRNTKNNLKHSKRIFSLKIPFKQEGRKSFFSFFPFLFFTLIKENPKVILIESTSLPNCISALFYAKLFNKRVIYWTLGKVSNKELSYPRKKLDSLINFIEKKTDAIFAYSNLTRDYFISRNINHQKIFVGTNVLDTREALKKTNQFAVSEDFRILFIGTIIQEKQLELLIEVFLKLESNYSAVYLDIVGSGSKYFEDIKDNYENKSKNLVFHGRKTKNLHNYYFKSDIFVLPGLGGLAISESMAYGVPVIASTADGTEKDLIINNETGILIENMSLDTLYSQLEILYNNRSHLRKMGENAKTLIENTYSFENYYKKFKDSVDYVLKTK